MPPPFLAPFIEAQFGLKFVGTDLDAENPIQALVDSGQIDGSNFEQLVDSDSHDVSDYVKPLVFAFELLNHAILQKQGPPFEEEAQRNYRKMLYQLHHVLRRVEAREPWLVLLYLLDDVAEIYKREQDNAASTGRPWNKTQQDHYLGERVELVEHGYRNLLSFCKPLNKPLLRAAFAAWVGGRIGRPGTGEGSKWTTVRELLHDADLLPLNGGKDLERQWRKYRSQQKSGVENP
jgi:hypothetical protein